MTVAEGVYNGAVRYTSVASMGPQLDSCGRAQVAVECKGVQRLQWGRNLTVAEGGR